jgi:hypothetical protein
MIRTCLTVPALLTLPLLASIFAETFCPVWTAATIMALNLCTGIRPLLVTVDLLHTVTLLCTAALLLGTAAPMLCTAALLLCTAALLLGTATLLGIHMAGSTCGSLLAAALHCIPL